MKQITDVPYVGSIEYKALLGDVDFISKFVSV